MYLISHIADNYIRLLLKRHDAIHIIMSTPSFKCVFDVNYNSVCALEIHCIFCQQE